MGRAVMEAMVTLDCRDILTAVRVPTLLLHRRGDQVAHIEAARYMAAHIPGARLVEFPGTNHLITMGHLEPLLDQIEDFVTTGTDRPATDQLLATLLAATIVSPTAVAPLRGQPDTQPDTQNVLNRQHGLLHQELTRFRGQQVWTSEECWLAAFMSPSRAIACADRIRTGLTALGLHLRAGIHTGECDVTNGAISGPPIRVAAHVAALAKPDEVLITSTVRDLIAGTHLTFIPHDVTQLPGTQDERPLYAIINTDQSPGP
jgi:class 3 adenylate cyclase